MRYKNISGIILAGGKSKRMGFFKPFLIIDGRRMIDVIINKLKPFFGEMMIVTDDKRRFLYSISINSPSPQSSPSRGEVGGDETLHRSYADLSEYKGIKVIEDLVKECGPLGGIYTGLKKMSRDAGFFIACDMPFLHNGLIERILGATVEGDMQDAVIPLVGGDIEPLHAVYSKKILRKVERALAEKRLSIKDFLKDCDCKYIEVREGEHKSFANINTREDLRKVKGVGSGE